MVAPPDDLTSWRPDDGSWEQHHDRLNRIDEEYTKARELGMTRYEYLALPQPRRNMLLQRKRAGRPARRQQR